MGGSGRWSGAEKGGRTPGQGQHVHTLCWPVIGSESCFAPNTIQKDFKVSDVCSNPIVVAEGRTPGQEQNIEAKLLSLQISYIVGITYVEVSRNANNGETKRQKINYEANNDRNLTKLNTHCLDLYQNEV